MVTIECSSRHNVVTVLTIYFLSGGIHRSTSVYYRPPRILNVRVLTTQAGVHGDTVQAPLYTVQDVYTNTRCVRYRQSIRNRLKPLQPKYTVHVWYPHNNDGFAVEDFCIILPIPAFHHCDIIIMCCKYTVYSGMQECVIQIRSDPILPLSKIF